MPGSEIRLSRLKMRKKESGKVFSNKYPLWIFGYFLGGLSKIVFFVLCYLDQRIIVLFFIFFIEIVICFKPAVEDEPARPSPAKITSPCPVVTQLVKKWDAIFTPTSGQNSNVGFAPPPKQNATNASERESDMKSHPASQNLFTQKVQGENCFPLFFPSFVFLSYKYLLYFLEISTSMQD